jgi:hypothetical protein
MEEELRTGFWSSMEKGGWTMIKWSVYFLYVAVSILSVLCTSSAFASQIVYSTFGPGQSYNQESGWPVGFLPVIPGGETQKMETAVSFKPTRDYTLDSIAVAVHFNPRSSGVTFTVSLAHDSGANSPGSNMEKFSFNGMAGQSKVYSASSSLHPRLKAGQQYWVVMSSDDLNRVFLEWLDTTSSRGILAYRNASVTKWTLTRADMPALEVRGTAAAVERPSQSSSVSAPPTPQMTLLFSPASIYAGMPAKIRAIATLDSDPSLVPSSVSLYRVDDNGKQTFIDNLHDDGTHGDAVANDNMFVNILSPAENQPRIITYQVSASYGGVQKSSLPTHLVVKPNPNLEGLWAEFVSKMVNRDLRGALLFFREERQAKYRVSYENVGIDKLSNAFQTARNLSCRRIYEGDAEYNFTITINGKDYVATMIFYLELDNAWRINSLVF